MFKCPKYYYWCPVGTCGVGSSPRVSACSCLEQMNPTIDFLQNDVGGGGGWKVLGCPLVTEECVCQDGGYGIISVVRLKSLPGD